MKELKIDDLTFLLKLVEIAQDANNHDSDGVIMHFKTPVANFTCTMTFKIEGKS